MRVKICGITDLNDMEAALAGGTDALGFLVGITHQAEDKIDPRIARELVRKVPPFVSTVVVTHLTNPNEIVALQQYIQASTLQIHDYVPPLEINCIRNLLPGVKIIKAIHVIDETSVELAKSFEPYVDALLLDSRTTTRIGGTGVTHDWNISRRIVTECSLPIILAGGLTPENVFNAVLKVQPFGVDVNSGVESNGKKDYLKVTAFVRQAKQAWMKVTGQ